MRFWSDEGGVRHSHPLRQGVLVLGRHPSCDVVILGERVSKRHLECDVEGGLVTIRDLQSANGTLVNGSRITSCMLKHGDEVSLGGYRLVLDTASAVPTPMEPSPNSFDYEPTDSKAAVPEPVPVPPEQPLSFDKEPRPDDTPVDNSFVPQAYAPASLQPQVVARDGRMYLRDPRTSNEVEIVPRGRTGGPADVAGYYAEKEVAEKKKNTYLIAGALVVAVLMIVTLALTSGPSSDAPPPNIKAFSRADYNAKAERAVELITEGNFADAVKELHVAHREYPSYQVAGALKEIAEQGGKAGQSRDEFNWLSGEASLRELMESRWTTAKVRTFASNRIDWIYDVQHQEQIADNAKAKLAAGEPEKALAEFEKLPPDSLVRKKYVPQINEIILACYSKHMERARDALGRMNWNGAIDAYGAANKFASNVQKADIAAGVRTARKRMAEQQALDSANARLREDSPDSLNAAIKLLDGVDDSGPLAGRKRDLCQRINARIAELRIEQKADMARTLYKAGRGSEAIQLITESGLTELEPLCAKIEKLAKLLKEAQAAYANGDYDLAKSRWGEAATEEPAADNAYHKGAVDKLAELAQKDTATRIAMEYNKRADAAQLKDDPETARRFYLKAMSWDPLATAGKDGLASLRHTAHVYYNQARDLRYGGETKKAAELFEKVLRYAQEGDELYKDATRHLSELRALPPEESK